jgi:hypothetical protein
LAKAIAKGITVKQKENFLFEGIGIFLSKDCQRKCYVGLPKVLWQSLLQQRNLSFIQLISFQKALLVLFNRDNLGKVTFA